MQLFNLLKSPIVDQKHRLFSALGCILLLVACSSHPLKKVDVMQKERFCGTLQYQLFYGAPSFGEDTLGDEREPTYILHVDEPFLFRDTTLAADLDLKANDCAYDTVKTIQIRVNPNDNKLKSMIGKKKSFSAHFTVHILATTMLPLSPKQ